MPNFYAHIRFCLAVRRRLEPSLRAVLTAERDAFLCGGFGPDPLYFYTGHHGPVKLRQVGLELHHQSGAEALEPFRRPILEERPYAASFAAGYLLHYLLDAHCHPFVRQVAGQGQITHFALEGEYDRYLLQRDGATYLDAFPKKQLPEAFLQLAAEMAPEVTPEIYQQSLREFRWVSLKMGNWAGKPVRHAVNAVSHVPAARPIRGMILNKEPDERTREHLLTLDRLTEEAVEPAVEELARFFEAVRENRPFSETLSRDFSGNGGEA